jgi:hypothetical protein
LQVFVVSSESEIKKDGLYILPEENISKLIIRLKGTNYNFNKE